MKYGAMNLPTRPFIDEVKAIGPLGFDYIELAMDAPECTPEKILHHQDAIKDLLLAYNLDLIVHLPTFVSIADLYDSIRKASIDEIIKALETGIALGVQKFVLHPGTLHGLGKQAKAQASKYAEKSLTTIAAKARDLHASICIENMFPDCYGPSEPSDFERIFQHCYELKLTLDIAHAHIGTNRNRSASFIERYPDKIAHLHISDNFGKEDNHLPIGAGMIYFGKIFKELKSISYDETMTIEVFSRDRDYLKMSRDKASRLWDAS